MYPAVASFTAATYVVLLSVGRQDPTMAYVLGLNAVVQGLVVWVLGDVCRRQLGLVAPLVCPAALSLGPGLDGPGHPARVSLAGDDGPGGPVVPADRQEPAQCRVDLPGARRHRRGSLFPLAVAPVTHRADRGEHRGSIPPLVRRPAGPAKQARAPDRLGLADAGLRDALVQPGGASAALSPSCSSSTASSSTARRPDGARLGAAGTLAAGARAWSERTRAASAFT